MHVNPLFMVFLPVLMVSVFSFITIAAWSDARRREREAFYRSETIRRVAEAQGPGAEAAVTLLREQERIDSKHRRESQRLGGVVNVAAGLGLMLFLRSMRGGREVFLVGTIPLLIGVALLVHAYFSAPKE